MKSLALFAVLAIGAIAHAQNTGLIPINDLGTGMYLGYQGGLYPGGVNVPPPAHLAGAMQAAGQVVPRNAAGQPDPDGLIVMIAIGMSNTCHEFSVFERQEDRNTGRNARLVIINTALGGQAASTMVSPTASYWNHVQQRLAAMGVTGAQVQVAWIKQANAGPPNNFPIHAQQLRDNIRSIANNLHDKFPNLRLAYLSSRIYAGNATGTLNPEPQAYQSAFSVKWLIEDQINGDPLLNYGQLPGAVRSPVLLWGPYLWADGTTPRSDGLIWVPSDFEGDGTHPAPSGEQKVGDMLSAFFASAPTAQGWWPATPGSAIVSIDVLHDAHVRAAQPASNFGSATIVNAQGGATPTNAYLGFHLGAAALPVRFAKLGLRVGGNGGGIANQVAGNAWTESTITWDNAPAIGGVVSSLPQVSKDGTFSADVTASVNGGVGPQRSFAITSGATGMSDYRSKESGQPARLTLVVTNQCYANCNGDFTAGGQPMLNLADFGCFQNRFVQQHPYADCNGDALFDLADFGCFMSKFAVGCQR